MVLGSFAGLSLRERKLCIFLCGRCMFSLWFNWQNKQIGGKEKEETEQSHWETVLMLLPLTFSSVAA